MGSEQSKARQSGADERVGRLAHVARKRWAVSD